MSIELKSIRTKIKIIPPTIFSLILLFSIPSQAQQTTEDMSSGCHGGVYVCGTDIVPNTELAQKVDACIAKFYGGQDVFEECFTDTFVGTAPELSMKYDKLGKPGRSSYNNFQFLGRYDTWFWKQLIFKPVTFIQQGNQVFQNQLWYGIGAKNADTGTPFCMKGDEPTCLGYSHPVDKRSETHQFPVWHLFELRNGKIDKWTVNYDMVNAQIFTFKDADVAAKSLSQMVMMLTADPGTESVFGPQ